MDEKKKGFSPLKTVLLCVLCFIVGVVGTLSIAVRVIGEDGLTLMQANHIIERDFVGEYDREEYMNTVLKTMVDALGDEWSYYLDTSSRQAEVERSDGKYVGIGITVDTLQRDGIHIKTVNPNGPAQEAGVQAEEIIRAVNGTSITPENWQECLDQIKGEEGSQVTLELEDKDGALRTVELVRTQVHDIFVRGELLPDQVGLLTLTHFSADSSEQLRECIEELTQAGAEALVLDLRYNPGGRVTELVKILDQFLPEGPVFITRDAKGHEQVDTTGEDHIELPLAVLVNQHSYSAAEFTAAQLQESGRAVVVGEKTYGKGFAQRSCQLYNGSAIHISISRYFLASGTSLIGTGVTPDVECSLSEVDEQKLLARTLSPEEDTQLQAAIQAILTERGEK